MGAILQVEDGFPSTTRAAAYVMDKFFRFWSGFSAVWFAVGAAVHAVWLQGFVQRLAAVVA
jgi:hypothetical protein